MVTLDELLSFLASSTIAPALVMKSCNWPIRNLVWDSIKSSHANLSCRSTCFFESIKYSLISGFPSNINSKIEFWFPTWNIREILSACNSLLAAVFVLPKSTLVSRIEKSVWNGAICSLVGLTRGKKTHKTAFQKLKRFCIKNSRWGKYAQTYRKNAQKGYEKKEETLRKKPLGRKRLKKKHGQKKRSKKCFSLAFFWALKNAQKKRAKKKFTEKTLRIKAKKKC